MKEAAFKVVELQRTVMKLRSQLKAKQDLQESHDNMQRELTEYKCRFMDQQKKSNKAYEHVRELKALLEEQVKQNTELKKRLKKYEKADKRR